MNPIPNGAAQNVQNAAPSPIEQGYAFLEKGDIRKAKERFACVADDSTLHKNAIAGVRRVIEKLPHTSDNEECFFECLDLLKHHRFSNAWFEKYILPFFIQHPDAKNRMAKIEARKEALFFQIKIMAHKMGGGEHFVKSLQKAKAYAEEALRELPNVDSGWHNWVGDCLMALSQTTPNTIVQREYLVAAIAKYELHHTSPTLLATAKIRLSMLGREAPIQAYFPSAVTKIILAYTSVAHTSCLRAIDRNEDDAEVDYGMAAMMEGCFTVAHEQFKKVVDRTQADSPAGIRARRNLEQVQKIMADPTSAFDFLNQCIQNHYCDSLAYSNDDDRSFLNCVSVALVQHSLSKERREQINQCEWIIDHVLLHFFAEDRGENRERINNRFATLQEFSKDKGYLSFILLLILWKGTNIIPKAKDRSVVIKLAEDIHALGANIMTGFILGDLYFEQYQQEKTEANFIRAKERLVRVAEQIKTQVMRFSIQLSSFGFELSEVFSQLTELYTAENNSAKVEECTQLRLQQLKISE